MALSRGHNYLHVQFHGNYETTEVIKSILFYVRIKMSNNNEKSVFVS